MKKLALTIAAFVGIFAFVACGSSPEAKFMKQADDMFAQAEKNIQAVDNFDDFYACVEDLQEEKAEMGQEIMAQYSTDGENALVPDEVSNHIYERATTYNHVEGAKFAELFAPYLDRVEKALDAIAESGVNSVRMQEYSDALDDMMKYGGEYDNVPVEIQGRWEKIVGMMSALDLMPEMAE